MAAEIATADLASKPTRMRRAGRNTLERHAYSDRALSELASALATLELNTGRAKDARRLFKLSLADPTENALAQAEWASHHLSGLDRLDDLVKTPLAYEARARTSLVDGQWTASAADSWYWYWDQPFSSEATIFGSYGTGIAGDFEQSAEFASAGLLSNPTNEILRNNAAYALLQLNRIEPAARHLAKIDSTRLDGKHIIANLATRGLLAYRLGMIAMGRSLYMAAVDGADRKYPDMQAMAAILMSLEELRAGTERARELAELALRISEQVSDPGVSIWRSRLKEQLDGSLVPQGTC
jgi:hypothetical protein